MKVNDNSIEQLINNLTTQGILESLNDAVSIQDTDFKILYQNQAQKELNGDHTGEYCYKAYAHRNHVCEECPIAISFGDGKVHKSDITTANGKLKVEITSSVIRDPDGNIVACIEISRDITERRKAEVELQQYRNRFEDMVEARTLELVTSNKQIKQEIEEHRWTEDALKKSEERYRRITEAITDYTYTVRVENGKAVKTTHCAACFPITGYSFEDFAADPYLWIKMVVKEDHEIVLKQAEEVLFGKFPEPAEHRIIRKDGVVRWVESTLAPNFDTYGNLTSYDGIVRDITKRKHIEEKLNEATQFNKEIIKDAAEGIIVFDKDLRYVVWNPFMERISGIPADKVLGRISTEVFPHLKEHGVDLLHKRALQGETITSPDTPFNVPQSGRTGWVSGTYSPHRNGSGEITGIVGLIRDITERKKNEKTLRFLSLVTEQISDSVITSNLDYKITYANKSFQRLYGYSAGEILDKSPDILNAETNSEDIQIDIYRTVSSRGVWRGELLNRRKDGSTFHCGLLVFPLHDKQGNIFAYTGIQCNITERKKAEEERERLNTELANKNKELEQVVHATSHDLRTPLVNIDGFSKELAKSVNEVFSALQRDDVPADIKEKAARLAEDDIPEALKYIALSISKMDSLLSGLLKLSRLGRAELKIENLDMNKLLFDVAGIFQSQLKKAGIKLEISNLQSCKGDEKQISRIFSNLIDNAVKHFVPERPGIIRISGKKEDGRSVYCVADNGSGIAGEHQEEIFDMFKQLEPNKSKGEGLGLTIVRKSVERHNGKIWLESASGKGSRFFVSLPAGH